jgi:hypothetical protein
VGEENGCGFEADLLSCKEERERGQGDALGCRLCRMLGGDDEVLAGECIDVIAQLGWEADKRRCELVLTGAGGC